MRDLLKKYKRSFFTLLLCPLFFIFSCENFTFNGDLRETLNEDVGTKISFYEYPEDTSSHIDKVFLIGKEIDQNQFPKYEHEDTMIAGWQYYKNPNSGSTKMPDNFYTSRKQYINRFKVTPKEESLYAVWRKKCKITFVTNCEINLDPIIVPEGEPLYWEDVKIERRRGIYYLMDWYTDPDFSENSRFFLNAGDDMWNVTGDMTLYAKWVECYTVTYHQNYGDNWKSERYIERNTEMTIEDGSNWFGNRSGYGFVGWATSSSGSPQYYGGDRITVTSDLNLYAVWTTDLVTVTYIDLSNTFGNKTATYGRGAHVTLGRVLNDERRWYDNLSNMWKIDGKDLVGYSTSSTADINNLPYDQWGWYLDGSDRRNYVAINENLTLYVYWKDIVYTVRFYYGENRSIFGDDVTVGWNQTLSCPSSVPLVAGKTFENWYLGRWVYNDLVLATSPFNFNTVFNDDIFEGSRWIFLVAKFTEGGNTTGHSTGGVSFAETQGSDINVQPVISGSTITFNADSTYNTYTWYLNDVEQTSYTNQSSISFNTSGWTTGYYDVRLNASLGSTYYSWQGKIQK